MTVFQENFNHTQVLQKHAYSKGVKAKSYKPGDKV